MPGCGLSIDENDSFPLHSCSRVDTLNVLMGHQNIVSNVRGTSAETFIVTQEGDDIFFLSSDAYEDETTAGTVDILYGVLDYMEKDLHLDSQSGRHRLMISDNPGNETLFETSQWRAKGVGSRGYAVLTKSSLENLADALGNIYFNTTEDAGNWFDGVTLWLGEEDDYLNVTSIPPSTSQNRSTTTVNAGMGNDVVNINLDASENGGSLFVANGQGGDDILDASNSTLQMILFGDGVRFLLCFLSALIHNARTHLDMILHEFSGTRHLTWRHQ